MNLLKSIFVLSVNTNHALPGRKLSRSPSVRGASLCAKCKATIHTQSDPQQARECRPQDCDICSKRVPAEKLQWVYSKEKPDQKLVIAKGRFAIYRATLDQGAQIREVAVKAFGAYDREEFEKELQIHCQLRHPSLLPLLAFCEKDNLHCLILPYKAGGDLRGLIRDKSLPISLARIRSIVGDICQGLSHLHTNGIIHRDLKPGNILLNNTQTQACIADFGSTRFQAQEMTCLLCGTVAYMAPEMFSQNLYTPAVDIYSLGVIMWEMWSRQEPWQDVKMPYAVRVENCLQRNQRPPMPPDTPPPLRELINLCWSQNFRDRPTAQEILQQYLPQLDAWTQAEKTLTQLPRTLHPRKMGGSLIVAPVTPRSSDVPMKVPSGELFTWDTALLSLSSPDLQQHKPKPPIETKRSAPILNIPQSKFKRNASPLSSGAGECTQD